MVEGSGPQSFTAWDLQKPILLNALWSIVENVLIERSDCMYVCSEFRWTKKIITLNRIRAGNVDLETNFEL